MSLVRVTFAFQLTVMMKTKLNRTHIVDKADPRVFQLKRRKSNETGLIVDKAGILFLGFFYIELIFIYI